MAAFDAQPVPFGFSSVVRPLFFEVGEQGMSLQDSFHGVGRKCFEHEVVQPGRVGGASVTLRPLADVAQCTHSPQGDAGDDVICPLPFHDVGEWQHAAVGIRVAMSHDQGECSNAHRPRDVAARACLAAPFQYPVVAGAELVGVVALVGGRPGVHEREHAADEQRRLVVGHGVGAGENGAGLAVFGLAVAGEVGVRGGEAMAGRSGLSHVTAGEHCPVRHVASRLEDEVAGDDPFAHEGRGSRVAAHGAVFQPCRPVEGGTRADTHVPQPAAVEDAGAHSDASPFAALLFRILEGHPPDGLREARVVAVHGLHVGFLRREAVVHDDFPPAAFAHDGQLHAVAEGRAGGHGQHIGVQDDAFRPDVVVGDVVMDMFDEAVVAHGGVVERGVADARPARHASGKREDFPEAP